MTEKRLIQYKVLCDDYEEVRRILFEIIETGEEIEGYHQIQEWVDNLYKENKQLKQDGLYWSQTAEARRKEIDKLRKDNSILKQQRDYLFDVIDEVLPHSGSTTAYNRMKDIGDVE